MAGRHLAWTQRCKPSFLVSLSYSSSWTYFLFPQLSHLPSLCNLNDDSGTIGSLTRSWAKTTPILPLQVLAMPSSVKNVSLTMGLSKRVCGKTLVRSSDFVVILEVDCRFAVTEYVCPKCHHFNASTRSKRSRQQRDPSPTASATSSPASIVLTTPRQPSPTHPPLLHSPQESDLPNVDHMEVDTEVDASTWCGGLLLLSALSNLTVPIDICFSAETRRSIFNHRCQECQWEGSRLGVNPSDRLCWCANEHVNACTHDGLWKQLILHENNQHF